MALPSGAVGFLWFVIVVYPDHTHLLFLRSLAIIEIKRKKLTEYYNYFSLILMTSVILSFVQKIGQMWRTSIWDCEKLSVVGDISFLFHKLTKHA